MWPLIWNLAQVALAECLFEALKQLDHFEVKLEVWLKVAKAWDVCPKNQLKMLPADGGGGLDKQQFIQFVIQTCVKSNTEPVKLKRGVTKSFMIVGERSL